MSKEDPVVQNTRGSKEGFTSVRNESGKLLLIPNETTLNQKDWEMIEDDLLPFEITAILISFGGLSLIGLAIHAFTTNQLLVQTSITFFNGLAAGPLITFFFSLPIVVGTVQILLAVLFSLAAALEKWKTVSIQDVIRHHLPKKIEHYANLTLL